MTGCCFFYFQVAKSKLHFVTKMQNSKSLLIIILALALTLNIRAQQSLPPWPVVPCNVSKVGLPGSSASIKFDSSIQDYIGLKVTCITTSTTLETINCLSGAAAGSKNDRNVGFNDGYCLGVRDSRGNVFQSYSFTCTSAGYSPCTVLLDPVHYASTVRGTYTMEVDYWSLVQEAFVPPGLPHKMGITESYGVSQTSASLLSDSVGVETQDGWNSNYASYTEDMSSRLTEAFLHQVTIDESVTIDETFYFNATSVDQVDGVYQLIQMYQTIPSTTLQNAISTQNANLQSDCYSFLAMHCYMFSLPVTYKYSANTYLQIVGTDSTCK